MPNEGSVLREKSFYRVLGGKWTRKTGVGQPPAAERHGRARKSSGTDRVGIVEGSSGYRACGFKVQVPGLVRVMGIVALRGVSTRGKFEPQGVNGVRRPVPGAASSGAPRESLANFRDGTMWGLKTVTVDTGPVGSVFGEHSFYRETWGSSRGDRHVANRSSDPPGSLPRSQSSGMGPSASCGYCCPLCHTGGRFPGKIVFTEPQVVNGQRRLVPGAPSSGTPRESQAKFRDGTSRGL